MSDEYVLRAKGNRDVPADHGESERTYRDVHAYIAGLRARLRKKGIRAHAHVLLGPVVGAIADMAALEAPSLFMTHVVWRRTP